MAPDTYHHGALRETLIQAALELGHRARDMRLLHSRGALGAADATNGKKLWSYPFTESLHTSPMSFVFDNKEYVGMTVGSVVYVFGLPD